MERPVQALALLQSLCIHTGFDHVTLEGLVFLAFFVPSGSFCLLFFRVP